MANIAPTLLFLLLHKLLIRKVLGLDVPTVGISVGSSRMIVL
jgi:hypothetical protein